MWGMHAIIFVFRSSWINIFFWLQVSYSHIALVESERKWSSSVMSNSLWPHGCSLPGSFLHGILQARILEWVAISISISFSFLTQGSNPGLLHWRQMLLPLSHKGSLVICPQLILQSLPLFQTLLCHLLELPLQNLQSSPSPLHILIEFWFGSEDTTSLVFTIFSPSCELHGQE